MTKQTHIAVIPRYHPRHKEVLLFLPEDPVGVKSWMGCYAHIGQHGDACLDYYRETTPHIPEGQAQALRDLLREYEMLGLPEDRLPLKIYKRDTAKFRAMRFK